MECPPQVEGAGAGRRLRKSPRRDADRAPYAGAMNVEGRRLRRGAVACVLAAAALAAAPAGAAGRPSEAAATGVLALIDSGINPYHSSFRDTSSRARRHPSSYIPGYPKNAIALRLSLGEPNYAAAVADDCATVWSRIEPGVLYWFPGTRIVGAITFASPADVDCGSGSIGGGRILDVNGHGTMTASRAASSDFGACRKCHVVAVQFSASPLREQEAIDALRWTGENASWIDAQSNSWGTLLPAWEPSGIGELVTANPELVRTIEETARSHPSFWGSGNGVAFRLGIAGHPTLLVPHLTPSTIIVGGHDSGYVSTWPGFSPQVVSDACNSWAAFHDSIDGAAEDAGGGTSAATPYAAGGAVEILRHARGLLGDDATGVDDGVAARGHSDIAEGPLADGELTVEEWRRLVFVAASPRPEPQFEDGSVCGVETAPETGLYSATPVKWSDLPPGYPEYLQIGYGAVDAEAVTLARTLLGSAADAPDRAATDRYFAAEGEVRRRFYDLWSRP